MLAAWAQIVYRHPWRVLLIGAAVLLVAVLALLRGGPLTSGLIEGIESERALVLVKEATGRPAGSQLTVVFSSTAHSFRDAAFGEAMRAALAPAAADPRVLAVETPADVPAEVRASWVSPSGHVAVAQVFLRDDFRVAQHYYSDIRRLIVSPAPALEVTFTGYLPFKHDLDRTLEKDVVRAEIVSVPLALIVLLAVFATVVAAVLPVAVGALAVVGGVAAVMLLSHVTEMAQYTINVVTLIGLGVAIDYSLFLVSRYRDELARGLSVERALVVAVTTAGRAVTFSGLAVGIGLAGLLFYPHSYLYAMGLAGAIVVGLAVLSALTILPALLATFGERIHAGRLAFALPRGEGLWRAIAHAVMARPLLTLIPTLALAMAIGSPFVRLRMAAADMRVLPLEVEARRGHELLRREIPERAANRIVVAVEFPSEPALTPERAGHLFDLSRKIAALPGVTKVESLVDLDPSLGREAYVNLYRLPAGLLPSALRWGVKQSSGGKVVLLSVIAGDAPDGEAARAVVRAIRRDRAVGDGTLLVTGATANDVDSTDFILGHTPRAVLFVMAMTYLILFLLLDSVVLPLKAVLMNLLSIAGSFGALVWIFQDGHLSSVLHFEPGPIEPTLPVLLFCALFGLSMDYEVLLLSRIYEEYQRDGDNARAVAEGLERSGRLITSAAAIMVAVFAAFALADIVLVKAMGLGMALAVALDATLVRILIVPATMRLFGDLNWWAPRFLKWK